MDLAGSKLRKKMGSTLQESVSAPTSAFAKQQLEKMGWTEGTGLGKKRNGITTHIKVKKRVEGSGIGTEKQVVEKMEATENWWKDSLGDTLERLASKGKKKKKKSSKRKREFTDEDLFKATGGARFGMRAMPTRNLSKWRRTETEMGEKSEGNKPTETNSTETVTSDNNEKERVKKEKKAKKRKQKEIDAAGDDAIAAKKKARKEKKKAKKAKKSKRSD